MGEVPRSDEDTVVYLLERGPEIYKNGSDNDRATVLAEVKKLPREHQCTVLLAIPEIPNDKRVSVINQWEDGLQDRYYKENKPDYECRAEEVHRYAAYSFIDAGANIEVKGAALFVWLKTGLELPAPDVDDIFKHSVRNAPASVALIVYFHFHGKRNAIRAPWMKEIIRAVDSTKSVYGC